MKQSCDQNATVDIPEPKVEFLDFGLAAAYGKPRSTLDSMRPILLREAEGESAYVVKPQSDAMPTPAQIGDRYQLSGEIARGGMGAILRGRDVDLGRDLAIKVLLEKYTDRPEVARRFIEEAQIGGQLQHPGVVPVYDIGRFGDRPFFTMKLIKGETLAALLSECVDPRADRPRFLSIALQVAQTLAYAHAKGVIHRDLKPANIMVGAFGEVQVMDWGLAKVLAEGGIADEERLSRARQQAVEDISTIRTARSAGSTGSFGSNTETGSLLGTPAYMPPEQAKGDVALLDRRADVFGLGAILCEILTGKPPYVGRNAKEVHRKAALGDLVEAYTRLASCGADAELIALTTNYLAPEAMDRPKDAQAVVTGLSSYLNGVQARLHKAELAEVQARTKAIEEVKRRRLTMALAATVLATMILGGGGWLWVKTERDAREMALTHDVNDALHKATVFCEQAKAANAGSALLFAQAREQAQRALALIENGPADPTIIAQVRQLQAELDEEEKDRTLVAALDEARLAQAETVVGGSRFAEERAVPRFREAFRAFGLPAGEGEAKVAAERIQQRPEVVRDAIIGALDEWIYLADKPFLGITEPHQDWLRTVLEAVEPTDAWSRKLRSARAEKDDAKRRVALENLAMSADVAKLTPHTLARFAWQLDARQRVALLRRAQRQYPADFWINHNLGIALGKVKPPEQDEAVRFLTAAVSLRPHSSGALVNLGAALRRKDHIDEAVACFRKAIELEPKNALAPYNLGHALEAMGQIDEAIVSYRKAIEVEPKYAQAHNNLGAIFCDSKRDYDAAISCFRIIIKLDPNIALAHYNLGTALKGKGLIDEAIASYRKALDLDPQYKSAYYNLGIALNAKGLADEAIASYRKALDLDPKDAAVHFNLGHTLQARGLTDEAIANYRKALELNPKLARAYQQLAAISCDVKHDYDEAIALYRKAIELEPESDGNYHGLGNSLKGKGLVDEAVASYRKALELNPKMAGAYYELGAIAYEVKRDYDEAIVFFRKAIELKPKMEIAFHGLGNALRARGQLNEALDSYHQAIKLNPKNAQVHLNIGLILFDQGKSEQAVGQYRQALGLDADSSRIKLDYALAERLVSVQNNLPACLKGDYQPSSNSERLALAELCTLKKLHHAATRLYTDAFKADPKLADDLSAEHHFNAACNAALAAAGQGADTEKARLRKQALDWLRAELAQRSKLLEAHTSEIPQMLKHWQQESDLASIREQDALGKLPAQEQKAFTQLWADVAALLKKAEAQPE